MNTIRKYWKTHISFQNNENIFIVLQLARKGKNHEYILDTFMIFAFSDN